MTSVGRLLGAAFVFFAISSAHAAPNSGGSGGPVTQPTQKTDPAQSYQEGVEALDAGDYKKAEQKFGEVLRVVRDMPEANYYMGVAKVGRQKHKASVKYFKRAIKERPNFVEAREELALVLIVLEKPEEAVAQQAALEDLKKVCAAGECDETYVRRIDKALTRISAAMGGDVGEVSAVQFNNDSFATIEMGEGQYSMASRLINQSRYEEAIENLFLAQAAIGPHPDILNYLGYSHRKLGDMDKAKSYYSLALKINPDHLGAIEYLGELYVETGDLARAKQQLARLDELCTFGCAEREDLARHIEIKETIRRADR